jgi:hypothetical protein
MNLKRYVVMLYQMSIPSNRNVKITSRNLTQGTMGVFQNCTYKAFRDVYKTECERLKSRQIA